MLPMSDYELRQMRKTQLSAAPELVDVYRRVLSDDGFGGRTTEQPMLLYSQIPARIAQAQVQAMGGQAGRTLLLEKWTIRFMYTDETDRPDIQDEDLVDWGDIRLQVEDVKDRSWETVVSCMGEVVK